MQAVHENQQQKQCGQQSHPNPWGEEACTVTGVGEAQRILVQTKALNLYCKKIKIKNDKKDLRLLII